MSPVASANFPELVRAVPTDILQTESTPNDVLNYTTQMVNLTSTTRPSMVPNATSGPGEPLEGCLWILYAEIEPSG